jgi:cytochrome c556
MQTLPTDRSGVSCDRDTRPRRYKEGRLTSMLRYVALAAALAVGATGVYAQNLDVIKQRREAMRAIAGQSGPIFKMVKGEAPFDLAKVQAGIKIMSENLAKYKGMFPDNAKEGGGTDVSPRIWTARAEFNDVIDKYVAGLNTAAVAIKDEASFKAEYPKAGNCGTCHKATDGFTISLSESFKKPRP